MTEKAEQTVNVYGADFAVTDLDRIEHRLIEERLYERPEISLIAPFLQPGTVALDIGANIGVYSLFMAMMLQPHGRVIAFEPFPINYDRLVRNIRLNKATVEPVLCALGEETETRSIHFKEQGGKSKAVNYGGLRIPPEAVDGNLNLQIYRLDELIAQYEAKKISFMKIDVERWEVQVLRGAKHTIAKHRPTILIEVFDSSEDDTPRSHKNQLMKILQAWGYTVCKIIRKPVPHFRPVQEADLVAPVHFNALCIHRSLLVNGYAPMGVSVEGV